MSTFKYPIKAKCRIFKADSTWQLYKITATENTRLKKAILTMVFNGALAQAFKLRLNLYADANGKKLLLSSTAIDNADIVRGLSRYCEIRFDFEKVGNSMIAGNTYLLEFEVYNGYTYDKNNYVGLVYDFDNLTAIISENSPYIPDKYMGLRASLFFER